MCALRLSHSGALRTQWVDMSRITKTANCYYYPNSNQAYTSNDIILRRPNRKWSTLEQTQGGKDLTLSKNLYPQPRPSTMSQQTKKQRIILIIKLPHINNTIISIKLPFDLINHVTQI